MPCPKPLKWAELSLSHFLTFKTVSYPGLRLTFVYFKLERMRSLTSLGLVLFPHSPIEKNENKLADGVCLLIYFPKWLLILNSSGFLCPG